MSKIKIPMSNFSELVHVREDENMKTSQPANFQLIEGVFNLRQLPLTFDFTRRRP